MKFSIPQYLKQNPEPSDSANFPESENELEWFLPINLLNRQTIDGLQMTEIGEFGVMRKPRPGIPAHLHSGIDLLRPSANYNSQPVFPAAIGVVISIRDDGAFAQIIVEHQLFDYSSLWTVYEHIAGIKVKVGETVDPLIPMARFMNQQELDRNGWQFDHLHFEIMKMAPMPANPDPKNQQHFFNSHWLDCKTPGQLSSCYFDPLFYLDNCWKQQLE
ncbi:MAG: M23 family metallopeptidase [Bacteroidales bacterium]|nr:M23 family metallopeptidase [Bacteroidales bacterium]